MQSTSEFASAVLSLIFGVGGFLLLWQGILYLTSLAGGWNKLSKLYTFKNENISPIKVKSFQSAQFSWVNYHSSLKFLFYREGLGIKVFPLFRFKHPNLLIPWKDIYLKEKSKSIFTWNQLEIGKPVITTLSINKSNLEEILPYLNKSNSSFDNW